MLCQKCKQQEAHVHLTQIINEQMDKFDLCEACAGSFGLPPSTTVEMGSTICAVEAGWTSYSPDVQLSGKLADLATGLGPNPRFPLLAYDFVRDAVDLGLQTAIRLRRDPNGPLWHISGAQLLLAFRELALQRFGKRARAALAEWDIHRTEDIGAIVFELVDRRLLSKTETDKPEDFANGYDFSEAFPES